MYVRDCHIENVGPIQSLDLQFPLREDGTPKPVVLLGENGTGKSTLLSMVADALLFFQQRAFTDVTPGQSMGSTKYLRIAGRVNQRNKAAYGLSVLRFENNGSSEVWVEKTGSLKAEEAKSRLGDRFGAGLTWQGENDTFKDVSKSFSNDDLEQDFAGNSYCYFPSERNERPSWLNSESVGDTAPFFRLDMPVRGRLGKPLVVTSSVQLSIPWIMDVILDARVDLSLVARDEKGELYRPTNNSVGGPSRQLLDLLNRFLRLLLGNNSARFGVSPRANPLYRLCVVQDEDDTDEIPSLSCLSSGQAALLGIFMTVLRYSDSKKSLGRGSDFGDVDGIVLIDEADAHLHTRLQYEVLPSLISSFPKVQFLLTSHSPVLLLGMEKRFGRDGFVALEMPLGTPCNSDDYPEAAATVRCFTETKEFKDALAAKIKENTPMPRVFMEGKTDVRYTETAFRVLGHSDTLARVKLDTFATTSPSGDVNGGSSSLKKVEDLYKTTRLFSEPVLLLYDFDATRPDSETNGLAVRSVHQNQNPNSSIKKGIENLLPDGTFPHGEYYAPHSTTNDYGGAVFHEDLKKEKLSEDLCSTADPIVFEVFRPIVETIENWLESIQGTQSPIVPAGADSAPQTPVASANTSLT